MTYNVFALKYFGVTAMEYTQTLPYLEVLIINLITLNHCFKRKYSVFKTVMVFLVFTVFLIVPIVMFNGGTFNGNGKFSIFGFIYIIPLKILYDEKYERLLMNMCMSWTYTLGIMAVSVQVVYILGYINYGISLTIVETVLFLLTFIPLKKFLIPKYCYIFQNLYDFRKTQFRYLGISAYLNFFMLFILHVIFLSSDKYLLQTIVLGMFLAINYILFSIVYEVINSSVKIDELEKKVSDDALTGLGNRVKMMRHMRILIEQNQIFSIMFLDLDRFKLINDRYGHNVGDRYLIHFGKVCSDELKDNGKLYRYGGDEFVVIYYGVLTEEIADSIAKCENWDEGAPCEFNQVSAGFVVCRPPYTVKDPEAILKQADNIMYRNKLNKKMRYREKE